jgi:two-component system, LuxR family, sensor kinase FixL
MVVDSVGNLVRGNAFLSALLGWDEQPPQEQTALFDLVAPHDQAPLHAFLISAAEGQSPPPLDTELRPLDRPPRRVRWLGKQYKAHGSAAPAISQPLILCVGQDITDLTEAQRQLVRQERLAAIGQTMTGLAHESRNAFQRSQAALETLTLELEDRPAAVELIERIQRAHDHLLHLYEEVLQFARPVHLELQQVHLDSLTRQTWDHLATVRASKQIRLSITGNTPPLTADPFAVEQILRNLLENAIHASDTEGQVDVHFAAAWIGARPALRATIRDYGTGIPAPYRDRIFEPFFTTRSRGTGLGLPIARRLAEGHGGSLNLEAADPGTSAILILPLAAVPDPEVNLIHEDPRRSGLR